VCASANGRGLVRHGLLHPPSADLAAIVAPLVAEPGAAIAVDFRRWLSITSADIVAHSDPEQRRKHRAAGTGTPRDPPH
jgi:hypothetical protein